MSSALLDGYLPYRDIFLHKTPGAAFLGAAGAWLGAEAGLTRTAGAHLLYLFFGALAPAQLFLLVRRRASVGPALLASLLLMGYEQWPLAAIEGVRPKVATVVLGLACLLAGDRRAWRWSGFWGAAAALCWQPGLVFPVAVALAARDRPAAAGVLQGAAILLAVFFAWLVATGTTQAFFADAVVFNLWYVERGLRTPLGTLRRLWRLLGTWDRDLLPLGSAALLGMAIGRRRTPLPPALTIAGLCYLGLTFASLQAWPDTILFGPPLAAAMAGGLVPLLERGPRHLRKLGWAACFAGALAAAARPHSDRFRPPTDFSTQGKAVRALLEGVGPDEPILVIGAPEVLIHSGRHNAWPWLYMWFGVDAFAAAKQPGGFDALLASLEPRLPARIFLARRWRGPYRQRFEQWAAQRYERHRVEVFPHTTRPLLVFERRAASKLPVAARAAIRTRP